MLSVENLECGKCGVCIFFERLFYHIVTIAYKQKKNACSII